MSSLLADRPDADEVRRTAEEILARPEYREPQPSLADRVFQAVGDALGSAFEAIAGSGAGNLVGAAVVLVLLVLAGWLLAKALRAPGGGRLRDAGAPHTVGTAAPDDPADWAREAERLSAAGDHRGALRCRYQELVAHLVRDRIVPDEPARTPAELHAALAGARPALADDLSQVTARFEATWYGGAPVDAAGAEDFRDLAGSVREQARRAPAVAG